MTKGIIPLKLIISGLLISTSVLCRSAAAGVTDTLSIVSTQKVASAFTLWSPGKSAPLVISSEDWPGVVRAYKDLQADIGSVTGAKPGMVFDKPPRRLSLIHISEPT